jgi:hypothetical protein
MLQLNICNALHRCCQHPSAAAASIACAACAFMLDNLFHYLVLIKLECHDCHAAALQLSVKACLPHLEGIVRSISALNRDRATAAILQGSTSPSLHCEAYFGTGHLLPGDHSCRLAPNRHHPRCQAWGCRAVYINVV